MFFLFLALVAIAVAVPLVLLISWPIMWWRQARGTPDAGERRSDRRVRASMRVVLGLWVVGVALVSPGTPALGSNQSEICLVRDTPAELSEVVALEAIRVDPELIVWPWGYRCTFTHQEYDGTVIDDPGWGPTVAIGIGAAIVATGATTLTRTRTRTRGRDGTAELTRA